MEYPGLGGSWRSVRPSPIHLSVVPVSSSSGRKAARTIAWPSHSWIVILQCVERQTDSVM